MCLLLLHWILQMLSGVQELVYSWTFLSNRNVSEVSGLVRPLHIWTNVWMSCWKHISATFHSPAHIVLDFCIEREKHTQVSMCVWWIFPSKKPWPPGPLAEGEEKLGWGRYCSSIPRMAEHQFSNFVGCRIWASSIWLGSEMWVGIQTMALFNGVPPEIWAGGERMFEEIEARSHNVFPIYWELNPRKQQNLVSRKLIREQIILTLPPQHFETLQCAPPIHQPAESPQDSVTSIHWNTLIASR